MTYTCKKGLLVSQDANGNYVPFFLQVRDKDIKPAEPPISVVKTFLNEVNFNVKEEKYGIMNHHVITADGWDMTIGNDGSFEATTRVNFISSVFNHCGPNSYNKEYSLPFKSNRLKTISFVTLCANSSVTTNSGFVALYYPIKSSISIVDNLGINVTFPDEMSDDSTISINILMRGVLV